MFLQKISSKQTIQTLISNKTSLLFLVCQIAEYSAVDLYSQDSVDSQMIEHVQHIFLNFAFQILNILCVIITLLAKL